MMSSPENPAPDQSQQQSGQIKLDLAWDVLKELGSSERYFNNLEAEYQKRATSEAYILGTSGIIWTNVPGLKKNHGGAGQTGEF